MLTHETPNRLRGEHYELRRTFFFISFSRYSWENERVRWVLCVGEFSKNIIASGSR